VVRFGLCLLIAVIGGCDARPRVQLLSSPSDAGGERATDPAVAVDPERGDFLMAWLSGDGAKWSIRFARSTDRGRSWSAPVTVTPPGEPIHPHGESSPRLVAGRGGKTAVVWSTSVEVPGRQWPASDVRFARSLDGGRTWSTPVTLNDDSTAAPGGHSFHGAALAGESGLVVAWLDGRPPSAVAVSDSGADDATIYFVRSPDFGGRWLPNEAHRGAVCPCCRVQIAGNLEGRVAAAWRHHAPGQIRDIVIGDLEGEASPVHRDGWRFDGCPHSGPGVSLDADGTRHVLWYTGASGRAGVYYARQPAGGAAASPVGLVVGDLPVAHVSLAVSKRLGPLAAWDATAEKKRRISVARIGDATGPARTALEVPGSDGGLYPQLAAFEDGEGALVAWTQTGDRSAVKIAAIDWSP
jgi:hypothetical protein